MPTPPFVLELRRHVGNAPLWLMGATAIVVRDGRVLLGRRADTGEWAAPSGIVDPGEHPATTVVREAAEELGVVIEVTGALWLDVTGPVRYANGDQCRYLDHGFLARWISGEPWVADEESVDVGWFPIDALPEPRHRRLEAMVARALEPEPQAALPL